MPPSAPPWSLGRKGLTLKVRLTPKASRDGIDGLVDLPEGGSALGVRVRAMPVEGEANTALVKLLSRSLSLTKKQVSLSSGSTSRLKTIVVSDPDDGLVGRLEALAGNRET